MKKVLFFIVGLVVILAGASFLLLGNINEIVKTKVEEIGTDVLGTPVRVSNVNIKLLDGLGELGGFSIDNPQGFKDAKAFSFDTVRLDIDPLSATKSPIVIEEILLDSVSALYEVNAQGKGNLNALLDNAKQAGGSGGQSSETSETEVSDSGESDPVLIRVNKITVKDTQLQLDLTGLGLKSYDETLPTFFANNVGGEQGLPPAQLGAEIGKVMFKNLSDAAEKKQKEKLKDKLKDKAKEKLEEKLGDKLDGEIGDKVKGLFDKF